MRNLLSYKRLIGVAVAAIGTVMVPVPREANAEEARFKAAGAEAAIKKADDTGCNVLAIKPYHENRGDNIVAANSTSCRGPVKNVSITVRLYQFNLWWIVYAEKSQKWGNVPSTRNGSLQTWGQNVPGSACTEYMTQAVVKWNAASGTPYQKVNYSKRTFMTSAGPCKDF